MPAYPDLLSDDIPSSRSGTPPLTSAAKTKGKSAKSKRKHEATAEQAGKEKAIEDIASDETMHPLDPPSPTFAPSVNPANAFASPAFEAIGDQTAAGGVSLGGHRNTYAYPGSAFAHPGSPPAHPSPRQYQTEDIRGGFSNNQSPPTSPRLQQRFPSRRSSAGYHLSTSPRGRPISTPKPQFYRDSEATAMPMHSRSRSRKSGPGREYLALDFIQTEDTCSTGHPCLLLAAHESLHVHKVEAEGIHPWGYLQGLRGRVVAAKILPVAERYDHLQALRPLVAMVVHGPAQLQDDMNASQHSEFDPSESVLGALQTAIAPSQFQTSVEVYSLRERKHVCTLYRCSPSNLELLPGERWPMSPLPSGALSIQAKGRFVTVTSAVSGEVYIYETARAKTGAAFRCIGKTWTSLPSKRGRTWSASSTETDHAETSSSVSEIPILSLSHRWLAIAPPVPSVKSTLHGTVDPALLASNPPGIASHTASSQPQVTCELDTPLEESRLNKVTRDVTQEVLKGARWVGDQGMQAWKNYWNKTADQNMPYDHTVPLPQFPPTHANEEVNRVSHSPTLVSVLDLDKLSESQDAKPEAALQPCATFSLSDGCSYLSFSPSGLQLLTASTKGDVNFVWDLMRMLHGTCDAKNRVGPLVRQVARFSRITTANIIDIAWTEPRGEKLAILTDRGTVHIHDIPPAAFLWPPPKLKRPGHARVMSSDAASPPSGGGWGAAFNAVSGGAQPILAAVRGNPLPAFSNFNLAAAGTGAGVKGGKLVANGFSKSVGAATDTVNSLRHMGENRLHLSPHNVGTGFVRWLAGKDTTILVIGEASLRIHSVQSNSDVKGRKNRQSVVGLKMAEFGFPKLPAGNTNLPNDGYVLDGNWPKIMQRARLEKVNAQPISHAEIETCAPFQSIYTDRRIKMSVYDNAGHHLGDSSEPWVFGGEIPTTKVASAIEEPEESLLGPEASTAPMEIYKAEDEFDSAPQTATTTKRKKNKKANRDVSPLKGDDGKSGLVHEDWNEDCM